jgi:hypothetical protein
MACAAPKILSLTGFQSILTIQIVNFGKSSKPEDFLDLMDFSDCTEDIFSNPT